MKTRWTVGILASAFMVLTVPVASAETPPPVVMFYPDEWDTRLPANVAVIAFPFERASISPSNVKLADDQGNPVPIDVTAGVDARGAVMARPRTPLAPGRYLLQTGAEGISLLIDREADTQAPAAITGLFRAVEQFSEEVLVEFPPPEDNATEGKRLGYAIYTAPVPEVPDTEGTPVFAAANGFITSEGRGQVRLMRGDGCLAAFPASATGRFNVSLRARDEAGNLGPASPPLELDVEELPKCGDEDGGGCSALPAPALLPGLAAVALWLSRRRRTRE